MSKEHCCCGSIHVRTGALIIGCLDIIFGIIGLLATVARGDGEDRGNGKGKGNDKGIVSYIFFVISGGFILYAHIFHKPQGYLLYLRCAISRIVFYTVSIVLLVLWAIFAPETFSNYTQDYDYGAQNKDNEIDPKTMSILLLSVAALLAFFDCIAIWFWMVVYRAYKHMKGVEEYDLGQTYQLNNV